MGSRRHVVVEYDEDADPDGIEPTWPADVYGPFHDEGRAEAWAKAARQRGVLGEYDIFPVKAP